MDELSINGIYWDRLAYPDTKSQYESDTGALSVWLQGAFAPGSWPDYVACVVFDLPNRDSSGTVGAVDVFTSSFATCSHRPTAALWASLIATLSTFAE